MNRSPVSFPFHVFVLPDNISSEKVRKNTRTREININGRPGEKKVGREDILRSLLLVPTELHETIALRVTISTTHLLPRRSVKARRPFSKI